MAIIKKLTSAYTPKTNGKAERANQTLMKTIRKLAEDNPPKWTEVLDFALLAMRTMVNRRAGFTPYETMFGVKCLRFEDWTNHEDEYVVAKIIQRAFQIKDLEEKTRP